MRSDSFRLTETSVRHSERVLSGDFGDSQSIAIDLVFAVDYLVRKVKNYLSLLFYLRSSILHVEILFLFYITLISY